MSGSISDDDDRAVPSNVLVACPAIGTEKDDHCRDLLTRSGSPGTILGVTVASSPGERMTEWSNVIDPVTTSLSFVDVSNGGRSASMSADGFGGQNGALVDVVGIDDVDLERIGMKVTSRLRDATNDPVVLCLDSLTDLLQFESERTITRFLNVLTARVEETGAIAHYHIDSQGHPTSTIETLSPLFDETIHVDAGPE